MKLKGSIMGFEFEKLEENNKPLHVANQLVKAIKAGNYKKGDKLPTEEELADRTGVSRASVREAQLPAGVPHNSREGI